MKAPHARLTFVDHEASNGAGGFVNVAEIGPFESRSAVAEYVRAFDAVKQPCNMDDPYWWVLDIIDENGDQTDECGAIPHQIAARLAPKWADFVRIERPDPEGRAIRSAYPYVTLAPVPLSDLGLECAAQLSKSQNQTGSVR